jgi:hypothetical protein
MRENAAAKARRYLVEGRVRILSCAEAAGVVQAEVRGNGRIYVAGRNAAGWYCGCPARGECAHLLALNLVTLLEGKHP